MKKINKEYLKNLFTNAIKDEKDIILLIDCKDINMIDKMVVKTSDLQSTLDYILVNYDDGLKSLENRQIQIIDATVKKGQYKHLKGDERFRRKRG